MPGLRANAVCLSGGYRTFESTVGTLRKHVLQPWDADAFAVMHSGKRSGLSRRCEALLNPEGLARRHCLVGSIDLITNASSKLSQAQAVLNHPATRKIMMRENARDCKDCRGIRARHLMLVACHLAVSSHETQRALAYSAYAHIRPDLMFYTRLPVAYLRPYGRLDVRIPPGDDWGRPAGLNPDLSFSGAGGFRAFADSYRLYQDPKEEAGLFLPGWTSEQLTRRAYEKAGANVTRPPLAFCKVNQKGECRYFGQLARNARDSPGFLRAHPQTAGLLCKAAGGPCAPLPWRIRLPPAFIPRRRLGQVDPCNRPPVCSHFCSRGGYCGRARPYREGGANCTGCSIAGASDPSIRCPAACRECSPGSSSDGGVGLTCPAGPSSPDAFGTTPPDSHTMEQLYSHPQASWLGQTDGDAARDPGWCRLLDQVDKTVIGGERLCAVWGGRIELSHRR